LPSCFTVACEEFPDLDDASCVLGQEEEEDTEEEEQEEEDDSKMPAVLKTKKPLRQSTLMQTMRNYYQGPTLVSPVAATMPVTPIQPQLLDRSFMPPFFITEYPIDPVTRRVGVIVNLPGGVASEDIHDVAVWLDEEAVELHVQVKLHHYMTGLQFFPQMTAATAPGKKQKYDPDHIKLFKLHLQMYQANLRLMAFDGIYYRAWIPLAGYNVSHGIVTEDDWEILQSKIPTGGVDLAILVVILRMPVKKHYTDKFIRGPKQFL